MQGTDRKTWGWRYRWEVPGALRIAHGLLDLKRGKNKPLQMWKLTAKEIEVESSAGPGRGLFSHHQSPHSGRLSSLISCTSGRQAPRRMKHGQVTQFLHQRAEAKPRLPALLPTKMSRDGCGRPPPCEFQTVGLGRAAALGVSNSRVPSSDSFPFPHSPLPESSHGTTLFLLYFRL